MERRIADAQAAADDRPAAMTDAVRRDRRVRPAQEPATRAALAADRALAAGCHPSYEGACLDADASDYDCVGGTGIGSAYVGTVTVVGPGEYGLDRDGGGTGCD
jgi:hypothetical protein